MNRPLEMWEGIGNIFVMLLVVIVGMALLVGLIIGLHYLLKGIEWCYGRCRKWWRNRNKPRRPAPPNPWADEPDVPPAPPPRPRLPKRTSRYGQQEDAFEEQLALGPRSPARMLYAAAFERLTDGELMEIRVKAPEVIERLHRAAWLLSRSQTADAENLLFVLRGYVRRHFGQGKHWLEAVIISDIATLCHYANKPEDAEHHFAAAQQVATPWLQRYPWLRYIVTRRRLIHSR